MNWFGADAIKDCAAIHPTVLDVLFPEHKPQWEWFSKLMSSLGNTKIKIEFDCNGIFVRYIIHCVDSPYLTNSQLVFPTDRYYFYISSDRISHIGCGKLIIPVVYSTNDKLDFTNVSLLGHRLIRVFLDYNTENIFKLNEYEERDEESTILILLKIQISKFDCMDTPFQRKKSY